MLRPLVWLLLSFAMAACSVFGPGGSAWPVVTKCAPSSESLISQVAMILMNGGDYQAELLKLAEKATKDAVVCAAQAATERLGNQGKISASPAKLAAAARGQAFLEQSGNQ